MCGSSKWKNATPVSQSTQTLLTSAVLLRTKLTHPQISTVDSSSMTSLTGMSLLSGSSTASCYRSFWLDVVVAALRSAVPPRCSHTIKYIWLTLTLTIGHVNDYPTMHDFGNPGHIQSMIAYTILTEYFLKFQWKLHCGNGNVPHWSDFFWFLMI